MMTAYIIKLVVLLPIMGALIFAALWSYRKYQPALAGARKERSIKMLETLSIGNSGKLVLIEFEGKSILLSATRSRIERITEKDSAS